MKFEGFSQKESPKRPTREDAYGNHPFVDGFDSDKNEDLTLEDEMGVNEEYNDQEQKQAVDERLEARAFSKEHSQFYRDRLAADIRDKRRYLADFLKRQNQTVESIESSRDTRLSFLEGETGRLESERAEKNNQSEKFESFKKEVSELEGELETIKSSFWRKLFGKEKLAELESRKRELDGQGESIFEPDRDRISELNQEIEKYKAWLEEERADPSSAARIEEIRDHSFFVQDSYVSEAKDLIKKFYKGNLELKRELEDDPMSRDVAENCREQGVLLRHGVPDPFSSRIDDPDWSGNNSVVDTKNLDASDRMLFAAAIQPALSTHTEVISSGHMKQGFLVGGGEITVASKTDLFSYASSFDSRNPKYDRDAVSSYSPNIRESFADAVNSAGDSQRGWNEIIVKHPEFSAIYIEDTGEYGQYTDEGHTLFYKKAKWALEQSIKLGMPAVVILESGQIMNIATDEEITKEELLARTIKHSPAERSKLFEAAEQTGVLESDNSSISQEQMIQRLETFSDDFIEDPEMEHRKQINKELAQAKLDHMEAERIEANRRVREIWESNK